MRDRLRPLWWDQLSIVRGKYLPQEKIGSGHTRFAQPCLAVHYDKNLIIDAPGTATQEGLPDMDLHWAEEDIPKGWEPGVHTVTGDLYDRHGQIVPIVGRAVLKKAIADWGARFDAKGRVETRSLRLHPRIRRRAVTL